MAIYIVFDVETPNRANERMENSRYWASFRSIPHHTRADMRVRP